VATALGVPLDVFVVRKLGVPGHEEFAMGAIASGGVVVVNDDVVAAGSASRPEAIQRVADEEARALARREQAYREARPMEDVTGRIVILVDDGLATVLYDASGTPGSRGPRACPGCAVRPRSQRAAVASGTARL
jgi:predicted phosphoribosyltransferase